MKFRPAIALLSLLLATSAFAADPALKQLEPFVGTWQCRGTMVLDGPPIPYTATVATTWVLGGNWLDVRVTQARTKENPKPYNGRAYIGYDAAAKKFVEGCVDNMGGYCTQSSSGWDGDKLVFEGTAKGSGADMGVRDTFVKKGANELTHAGDIQGADKKWTPTDEESCKRTK